MLIPTTISTVAAALQIMDYVIKLGKYLSSESQKILISSRSEIMLLDSTVSAREAEKLILQNIRGALSDKRAKEVIRELSLLFSLVEMLINEIQLSSSVNRIPNYGEIAHRMIRKSSKGFLTWGCFSAFGQEDTDALHSSIRGHPVTLESVYLTQFLDKSRFLKKEVTKREFSLSKVNDEYYPVTGLKVYYLAHTNLQHFVMVKPLLKGWWEGAGTPSYLYFDKVSEIHLHGGPHTEREGHITMEPSFVQDVIRGIMQDTLYYERKVRGEIISGMSFLQKVFNWLR